MLTNQPKEERRETRKKEAQEEPSAKPMTPKKRKGHDGEPSVPKKKMLRKITLKPKAPWSSDSDYVPSDHEVETQLELEQE